MDFALILVIEVDGDDADALALELKERADHNQLNAAAQEWLQRECERASEYASLRGKISHVSVLLDEVTL